MAPESATTRGRRAQAYTTPVMLASATAISAAVWLRPWIARSMKLAAAKITHAHQATIAPGSRNTLLWPDFTAWSDDTRSHSSGSAEHAGWSRVVPWASTNAVASLAPVHCRPSWSQPGIASGERDARQRLGRGRAPADR